MWETLTDLVLVLVAGGVIAAVFFWTFVAARFLLVKAYRSYQRRSLRKRPWPVYSTRDFNGSDE